MALARRHETRDQPRGGRRQGPALPVPRTPASSYARARGYGGHRPDRSSTWVWGGVIAFAAVVVGFGAWATISKAPTPVPEPVNTGPIDNIPCVATAATGESFRAHLDLWVSGRQMLVPANTGILNTGNGTCQYYLTSPANSAGASDNLIQVSAPAGQSFTLGQFFAIWGVPLSATDLIGHQAYADYSVRAYVDGRAYTGNPADIPITPRAEIVLEYGPPWHTPIPASYAFPAISASSSSTAAVPSSPSSSSSKVPPTSSSGGAGASSAAGSTAPGSSAVSSASSSGGAGASSAAGSTAPGSSAVSSAAPAG